MGKRSIWKGPYIEPKLLKKIQKMIVNKKEKSTIKTWSRGTTILPNFIGLKFLVYNGKKFNIVFVNEKMIGKKMGEFSLTRKFIKHSSSKASK